jgi:hypothetical protein
VIVEISCHKEFHGDIEKITVFVMSKMSISTVK